MALGFPPKFKLLFPLEELSHEQFLALALESIKALGWTPGQHNSDGFLAYTKFSMRTHGEEFQVSIDNGIATINSESTGSQISDWGKNRKNVERFSDAFYQQKQQLTGEILSEKTDQWKNLLLSDPASPTAIPNARKDFKNFFSLFIPVRHYFVTPLLIDINILVFVAMVISGVNVMLPDNESLIKWGANFRPITLEGEWWRLFTNFFLHIGLMHLLFNMYALLYIGLLLESRLGTIRFTAAYFLAGLTASMTSLYWHPLTISAGASGAIFGLYGVFLAMLTTNLIEKSARKALFISIGIFVAYNLINGLKAGIDNAAHTGGLCSGLLIGYSFYPSLKQSAQGKWKYAIFYLLSFFILLGIVIAYESIPNDVGQYEVKMKEFSTLEGLALEVYRLPKDTPPDKILAEIKERGLYFWNEDLKLVTEADQLKLPTEIHEKNQQLIFYCQLRIKSYGLIYDAIYENSDKYREQIQRCNNQIEAIINDLKGKTKN
jgi:rhomboid protease GluP